MMSWGFHIKVHYFYIGGEKKGRGSFRVSGDIQPHFSGVLHILHHCEVPNEMQELS